MSTRTVSRIAVITAVIGFAMFLVGISDASATNVAFTLAKAPCGTTTVTGSATNDWTNPLTLFISASTNPGTPITYTIAPGATQPITIHQDFGTTVTYTASGKFSVKNPDGTTDLVTAHINGGPYTITTAVCPTTTVPSTIPTTVATTTPTTTPSTAPATTTPTTQPPTTTPTTTPATSAPTTAVTHPPTTVKPAETTTAAAPTTVVQALTEQPDTGISVSVPALIGIALVVVGAVGMILGGRRGAV